MAGEWKALHPGNRGILGLYPLIVSLEVVASMDPLFCILLHGTLRFYSLRHRTEKPQALSLLLLISHFAEKKPRYQP